MSNLLAVLSSHFDALQPRREEIAGIPVPLLFKPLTAEQMIKWVNASNAKASECVRAWAELLVEVVTLEDGTSAFPLVKGGLNPIEVLTQRTDPAVFNKLAGALVKGDPKTVTAQVEDFQKKSDPPEPLASSPSTSSPSEEKSASPK